VLKEIRSRFLLTNLRMEILRLVKMQEDTVWLTQQQMAELFQISRTNIVEHIKHIYEEGELEENSTC
jgi:hypothetical protein